MSDFRQHFLAESINDLLALRGKLAEYFDENLRQEAFRTIHTVKGGAQTFGLETAARVAGELENTLSAAGGLAGENLLIEGIDCLVGALRENDLDCHAAHLEKARRREQPAAAAASRVLLTGLPPAFFKSFSEHEKTMTLNALRAGKHLYCAEVGFETANFADEYRNLRKILTEKSEIIASLPSEKYKSARKIGFLIFLASREPVENLQSAVGDFAVEISSHACTDNNSEYLYKMLLDVAAHGEKVARESGKQVGVTILSNDVKLTAEKTRAFFDILLHLIRNAVDHAIDRAGSVDVRFFDEPEGLRLTVADDGRGIDREKVRAIAAAKNLIAKNAFPDEDELLDLIFAPEFSTATEVTDISGRGVGLDAVRAAIEKLNGKISVRGRNTTGTIFEIFVPR